MWAIEDEAEDNLKQARKQKGCLSKMKRAGKEGQGEDNIGTNKGHCTV